MSESGSMAVPRCHHIGVDDPGVRPTGVVTFLFTDIEGSTRRWEAEPDAMRAALDRHDALLVQAIDAHGGWLFKHTGDGVCAAFKSPKAAVEAAVAAQSALELPVRMGVATGEADLRGGDYFGAVLNRTARVMSAGHGGQILLDGVTAELLVGVDLIDLGPHRLRDIVKPVPMYQMRVSGLRATFPPLKTVDTVRGNLRRPVSSLVGRDVDIRSVTTALSGHRLVTLTGVGGVGKTRLALEVAARSASDFPDGVFVIELASVGEPSAVPDAVAAVLGITRQPEMSLTESMAAALEGRSRLLVLDNCEHVLDAAADVVEAILARSVTVKILATSREGLRLTDEQLWPVPSLEVRTGVGSAAATLFAERARAVAPDRRTADDSDAVVEICQRLDGIPLAIELAASRMVSMTVTELRDRLDDRFRLLVGTRRGLERHQTLRHAVQWSYDLLGDAERTLLNRCSVFAGGFALAAATAVGGSKDEMITLDLLDALVRKSLVVADRGIERTRYSILETIRQFAEERLVQAGELKEVRTAHARYFAGLEAEVFERWDSPRQRESYEWFAAELANLRAAFRWAADEHDLDIAAAIATFTAFVGTLVEQYEPAGWNEELIEDARTRRHRRLPFLHVMASQCCWMGRIEEGLAHLEEARRLIGRPEFDVIPFNYGAAFGAAYVSTGQGKKWAEFCRLHLESGDDHYASAQSCLAFALTIAGDSEGAITATEGVVEKAEASQNPHALTNALLARGFAMRTADPAAALAAVARAREISAASGNRFNESHVAVVLSQLEAQQGANDQALEHLSQAIGRYLDTGNIATSRSPLAILAALLDRLGHLEPAATIAEFAANPLTRLAFPEVTTTIAHLRKMLGDDRYESLAAVGMAMSNAAMAVYAFEQIDRARAALSSPTGQT
jgi:predicted ATPase/class 3 adenylate cyclase